MTNAEAVTNVLIKQEPFLTHVNNPQHLITIFSLASTSTFDICLIQSFYSKIEVLIWQVYKNFLIPRVLETIHYINFQKDNIVNNGLYRYQNSKILHSKYRSKPRFRTDRLSKGNDATQCPAFF